MLKSRRITLVDRPELEEVSKAVSRLQTGQSHPFMVNITGMLNSGVSQALQAAKRFAERHHVPVVEVNIDDLPASKADDQHVLVGRMLEVVAQGLRIELKHTTAAQVGYKANMEKAAQIRDYLIERADPPVLIIYDLQDTDEIAHEAILNLESIFLARLEMSVAIQQQHHVMVLVGSKQDIQWKLSAQRVRTIALEPFTVAQTKEQLGCSEAAAAKVVQVTGGLAGANAYVWKASLLDKTEKDLYVDDVYHRFIDIYFKPDSPIANIIKATSLLNRGFDIDQFILAIQKVTYIRGTYVVLDKAYYFSRIDYMRRLGLVRYHNPSGLYVMEAHMRELLELWNYYCDSDHYLENCETINKIYNNEFTLRPAAIPATSAMSTGEVARLEMSVAAEASAAADSAGGEVQPGNEVLPQGDAAGLQYIFDYIVRGRNAGGKEAGFGEGHEPVHFVGRRKAIAEIAWYLCRQPYYDYDATGLDVQIARHLGKLYRQEIDIVLLRARAGSGKTFLQRRFLELLQEAIASHQDCKENCGVLVPAINNSEPSIQIKLHSEHDREPDFAPVPYIVDLEISFTSRLRSVRNAIRNALIATIGDEPVVLPPKEGKTANTVKDLFEDYRMAEQKWETLRFEARQRRDPEERKEWIQESRARVWEAHNNMRTCFLEACHNVARYARGGKGYSRIVLAFDTFDYPVRSGLSATQIISEVGAGLAGAFFFLISCRPPTQVEKHGPYIQNDLARYLPDDLCEQTKVIDLDSTDHALTDREIFEYYASQRWYEGAAGKTLSYRGKRVEGIPTRKELAWTMAEVVYLRGRPTSTRENSTSAPSGLPVLLSLVELYVGIHNGVLPENLMNNPQDLIPTLENKNSLSEEAWQADLDLFRRNIVDGVLRNVADARGGPSEPRQWALLLMSVFDRGLSWNLLQSVYSELSAHYTAPSATEIWKAVLDLAYVTPSDDKVSKPDLRLKKGSQSNVNSTLIKVVRSSLGKEAFKLHDYVSMLFNYYMDWRQEEPPPKEERAQSAIITNRELLVFAGFKSMIQLGEYYQPDKYPSLREIDSPSHHLWDMWDRWVERYQASRSNQVYYALRLAAIQYAESQKKAKAVGDPREKNHQRPRTRAKRGTRKPITTSAELLVALTGSREASETAENVLNYLYHKTRGELREYLAYGFADMLIQEVRYYVHAQAIDETNIQAEAGTNAEAQTEQVSNNANLILPIIDEAHRHYNDFKGSRNYYYATILIWEIDNRQFPKADPWLCEMWNKTSKLRKRRQPDSWKAITKILGHELDWRDCQRLYIEWLDAHGYMQRAHDACAVLSKVVKKTEPEWISLRTWQARAAIANPADITYRDHNGAPNGDVTGLGVAEKYLTDLLREYRGKSEPLRYHAAIGEVHNTYGRLCRIQEQLDWEIARQSQAGTTKPPKDERLSVEKKLPYAENWGALQHLHVALELQSGYLESAEYKTNEKQKLRRWIEYAGALNNYALVQIFRGNLDKADEYCNQSIQILEQLDQAPYIHESQGAINLEQTMNVIFQLRDERSVKNALGRAYYTKGEVFRYKAEVAPVIADKKDVPTQEAHYAEAITQYNKADSEHFELINREWQAVVASVKALSIFGLRRAKFLSSIDQERQSAGENSEKEQEKESPAEHLEAMRLQVPEMQEAIYSLYPNDKVDGYRRLVRMLNQARELKAPVPLTPKPTTSILQTEVTGHNADVVVQLAKKLEGEEFLAQEFILLQHAYELAKSIANMRNQLICTSDSVRLLARYSDHEDARKYFDVRIAELPESAQGLRDYRLSRMIGKSSIDIGMSMLDRLKALHQLELDEKSIGEARKLRKEAARLLKDGFRTIQFRSEHDWFVLRQHIEVLEENCEYLGEELAGLYAALQQLPFGPLWYAWLEGIDDKVSRPFLREYLPW